MSRSPTAARLSAVLICTFHLMRNGPLPHLDLYYQGGLVRTRGTENHAPIVSVP